MCSVQLAIVKDVKLHMRGHQHLEIEKCVHRLLSHDIDGKEDGNVDLKVDILWDELKHFQNWFVNYCYYL